MSDQQNGAETDRQNKKDSRNWVLGCIRAIHSKLQESRARKEQENAQDRFSRRLTRATEVIAVLTIAITAVGSLQYFTGEKQLEAIQGQLGEMKKQRLLTIAQLRANLRREQPVVHTMKGDGVEAQPGDTVIGWDINPIWTNAGNTEAKNIIRWWDIQYVPPGPIVSGRMSVNCPRPTKPYGNILPSILVQGGRMADLAKFLSVDYAKKAHDNMAFIFLAGYLEYSDVFPDTPRHHYHWCVALIPNDIANSKFSFLTILDESD